MLIKFFCPNGHKLSADEKLAGKKGVCPKCETSVEIPASLQQRITDTSVLDILGELDLRQIPLRPAVPKSTEPKRRLCSKCSAVIPAAYHICPNCKVYLGD